MPHIANSMPYVEEGFKLIEIEDIEEITRPNYKTREEEPALKLTVRCIESDGPGDSWSMFCSFATGEKSHLGGIVRAIMGHMPPEGIDTDDLIGQQFRAMVKTNEKGWPAVVPETFASATAARKSKKKVPDGVDPDTGEILPEAPF